MPSSGELSLAFLPHVAEAASLARTKDLEAELGRRLEAAQLAWPGVALAPSTFMRHLAERTREGLPPLDRAADLYLAAACADGSPSALEAFHRTFRADVARAVARTDASPAFLDDVMQSLQVKLFVRTGEAAPAIVEYLGLSSLRGWIATVAKRTALNLRRRKGDQPHDDVTSGVTALGTTAGPELALLKARYKAEFEAAIRVALAAVPVKSRTLLLLHLVNGLTLPQLAAMQKVSRATIARWLASARETLFEETRRELTGRLKLSPSDYESIVALVRSQLEVSLAAVVASSGPKA